MKVKTHIAIKCVYTLIASMLIHLVLAQDSTDLSHQAMELGYDQPVNSSLSATGINLKYRLATTVDQLLQGTSAGIYAVENSGQPGGEVGVHLRGFHSLIAGNQPLYVVDGIPYNNETDWSLAGTTFGPATSPLAFISPQDIESITVLKDAGATALYGSRGSNGVIIIKTKRILPDSLSVSFNMNFGSLVPMGSYELATAGQYATFLNEAFANAGLSQPYSNPSGFGKGTDWQDKILRKSAIRQNYHLGISGGNEKLNFYLAGEFLDQPGIIIGSDFQRYNFQANIDAQLNDKLILENSLQLGRIEFNTIPSDAGYGTSDVDVITGSRIFNPILPHQNNDGSINYFNLMADDSGLPTGILQSDLIQPNPLLLAGSTDSKSTTTRVHNYLSLKYHLLENLSINGAIGVDALFNEEYTFIPGALFFGQPKGRGSGAKLDALKFTNQYFVEFENPQSTDHHLKVFGGVGIEGWRREVLAGQSLGFDNETLRYYSLTVGQQKLLNSDIQDWNMQSIFGQGSYAYRDIYELTLTARADGSSIYGGRFSLFPAIAFSWNLDKSSLVRNHENISRLLIRTSIGSTGNLSIEPYSRFSLLNEFSAALNGSTINGISIDRIGNKDLKIEKTQKFNIGFQLGLKDNRWLFDLDLYRDLTDNAIGLRPLAATSGFQYAMANVASILNQGIEFSASINERIGVADASFQFFLATNKNKVESLVDDLTISSNKSILEITNWNQISQGTAISNFKGYTSNGTEAIFLGSGLPKFVLGFYTKWNYRRIDLGISLQGAFGQKMINANRLLLENTTGEYNVSSDYLSKSPTSIYQPGAYSILTEQFVENASYIRLKNLTLGYDIPLGWLSKAAIKALNIYIAGENLWTVTSYSGIDPDVSHFGSVGPYQGVDLGSYPKAKTYLLGLKIDL
ncbi:MAG: SusC/RagA family TonB-linked outer membrane protein [Saprospiraceae bacterium]|nr:SusC/RagA family TonB-linked outer membrane protein [Saprospiraceae bacterium]